MIYFKLYELLTGENTNYQLQVTFKLWINQSNLEVDKPVTRVGKKMRRFDPLMLEVTKKIQFHENITIWWKYYELTITLELIKVLWAEENWT